MYPRLLFLLLLCISCSVPLFAQTVTGTHADTKRKPAAYAPVVLLKADSSVAGGALHDEAGVFSIAPIGAGNYTLRVSGIGFATINKPGVIVGSTPVNIGTITVAMSSQSLQEVSVAG